MAYVNPSTQSIKTCFQSHYSLPYFQREYKWESKHFVELLNDIQNAFVLSYDSSHGRKEVSNYSPYFLGSIITSTAVNAKKPLIDGQQRLTATFLLLAYLERYRRDQNIPDALDLSTLLGNVNYGEMDYSVEFSATRRAIFDKYLDKTKSLAEAMANAEEVPNIDDGDKKLLEALRATGDLLNDIVRGAIAYFIDYVVERVLLIDISVDSESEAHRVFVTMNDRGLRLGPIDLLKGQILSKITSPEDSYSCHTVWIDTINKLRDIDPEEDSLFFRNLFRAKWAKTIRGKAKGDPAGDFDQIGDAYHRWFEEHTVTLGLATADDYVRFARDDITRFSEIYRFIKRAEEDITNGFECVYYNAARRYGFQSMVLLASVEVNDNTTEWKRKISLASKLIDILLTSRTIEGKDNNYDNLKDISFQLAKDLRGKNVSDLLAYVQSEWGKYFSVLANLGHLKYQKADRSDILFILARIASYLEQEFSLTNKVGFPTYWQRDRGARTFDIEHLLKEAFDSAALPPSHGFADATDYSNSRNLIGALTLLPRSRNRSLQDKPYREKLAAYATEGILAQTLCENLYQNNPNVATYVAKQPGLGLISFADFSKQDIAHRANSYTAIAQLLWQPPN
ncbi:MULTISPECIES: DUF262 domain-containing protein [unclassified Acidocella]|uniref:DUF262 domain-containing protein n=1 Tax=unclassified Acidocella TaxID=2648610 RepID=UPI00028DC5A6|nr:MULTISPECIES: DUF262 domain-containing protein [unclassified Acidocella]EKM99891.1 hypothetical protein MXAZACID_08147 [Acidocella sp. MX-AZ02]WBO59481.1 DUF262 domain-containing HNH endonuclease family protein [Acidocella sp. MX-AZ03]